MAAVKSRNKILAFDTANESIAIAIGEIVYGDINLLASSQVSAHRASNTKLLPETKQLFDKNQISVDDLCCVCAGRGPGSFTGVRIALATAKGIATGLGVGLVGINTLDAVAWRVWESGYRGHVYVVADAMRKEIYPALYKLDNTGANRLSENSVLKASEKLNHKILLMYFFKIFLLFISFNRIAEP